MTRQETQKLLMLIDSLYANWNPQNTEMVTDAWHEALKDYTYDEIYMSFMRYYKTDTSGFAPVPGKLIMPIAEKRINSVAPDEAEAWAMVREAIGNGIYHSMSEFKALPPLVQRAVGSASVIQTWAMEESESMEVIRSTFLRTYRAMKEHAVTENGSMGVYPEPSKALEQQFDLGFLLEERKDNMSEQERKELLEWWKSVKGGNDGV